MCVNITLLWDVIRSNFVDVDVSEEAAAYVFRIQYGGSRFLRNVGFHLSNDKALHSGGP
jgi:hypothetical protein